MRPNNPYVTALVPGALRQPPCTQVDDDLGVQREEIRWHMGPR